jgi:hypothetical protein
MEEDKNCIRVVVTVRASNQTEYDEYVKTIRDSGIRIIYQFRLHEEKKTGTVTLYGEREFIEKLRTESWILKCEEPTLWRV